MSKGKVQLRFFFLAITLYLRGVPAVYVAKYPFLYATEGDSNASFPVIENLSPEYRGLDPEEDDRPDFLYSANQGYRIVEFYIHWCNTCKLFAPIYRNFGSKVRELAAQQNIDIEVHAVSCSPNRKLCVDQEVKGFPKIRLYKENSLDYHELSHHTQIHPLSVLELLGIDFEGEEADWDLAAVQAVESVKEQPSLWTRLLQSITGENANPLQKAYRRTRDDLKSDIHLSLDYAMRHEIYTSRKRLDAEQQRVLRQWLELLAATIPASWDTSKLIHELIDNFIYIAKSEDYLVAVLDEYPAERDSWSPACSHGIEDEGYTCGLWEIFHVISVGLVDFNKATFDPARILSTEITARTIRDYVDTFFGCDTCRHHFVTTFDSCGHDRCDRLDIEPSSDENDWIELPLWLHETHNAVNVRLLKERAARRKEKIVAAQIKAVQWPSRQECPVCWQENWEAQHSLFKYLRLEYGQQDASTVEFMRELRADSVKATKNGSDPILRIGHASLFFVTAIVLGLSRSLWTTRKTKVAKLD